MVRDSCLSSGQGGGALAFIFFCLETCCVCVVLKPETMPKRLHGSSEPAQVPVTHSAVGSKGHDSPHKRQKVIGPVPMQGGSVFRSIKRGVKKAAKGAAKAALSSALGPAASTALSASQLLSKREAGTLPPAVRNILEKQGDTVITSLRAIRTPLDMVTNAALNLVTLGAFNKAVKKSGYDSAFHLALVINDKFVLDKQEVIKLTTSIPKGKDTQSKTIPLTKQGVTIGQLLEGARKHMGDNKFTNYNAKTNNCQDFIIALLEGNGLMPKDPSIREFIKQDAEAIFKKLPKGTAKIAKGVTDFAAKANRFVFGKGVGGDGGGESKKRRIRPTPVVDELMPVGGNLKECVQNCIARH